MNWLGRRNWVEAERAFAARLAQNADDERASVELAEVLRRQGRLDEALAVCNAALKRKPSPQLFFARALVENELHQGDKVSASLTAAAELISPNQSDDAASVLLASRMATFLGQREIAVATAHRAVVLNPLDPRALAHLGQLLIDSDPPLAEQRLRQSLKFDPEQAEAQNNLGAALLNQKKPEEAYEAFKAALELAPGYTLAATNLWALDVAKRRKSAFFPLVMVPLLASSWLAWTAVSFGREPQISWPRLGAALALMITGFGMGALRDRVQPRNALSQKLHTDMNEGRLGHRSAVPVLRLFGYVLGGCGIILSIGCAMGGVLVATQYLQSRSSNHLMGIVVLLAGMGIGALFIYESRNLIRQAAELQANRG